MAEEEESEGLYVLAGLVSKRDGMKLPSLFAPPRRLWSSPEVETRWNDAEVVLSNKIVEIINMYMIIGWYCYI